MRVFLWFSFLYFITSTKSDTQNKNYINDNYLSKYQKQQLYDELSNLSEQRSRELLKNFETQSKDFDQSKLKWAKLRQTLPFSDGFEVDQDEINNIQRVIRSGGNPIVRSKRTLKFLVKSLTEILGLRWTLLKYSLIPAAVNTFIGPPPPAPPASPAAPAQPGQPPAKAGQPPAKPAQPPAPAPRRPPPAPPRPPPNSGKPAPPPAAPPAAPTAAPPARPPPATIPPNQIDPNTIRYPFRPAPTIPFLTFAPLPPGVTVPYPPLFQWPAPAASPAPPMPSQPPCAAPPPPPPKNIPRTPSILPLPKPRAPVPPPPKPVAPVLPASPGKTPLRLEYDQPVRIEIFNNVKPHLPVSGTVYSGEPSLTSLEEQDERENEQFLNPTQAINSIEESYNTEPAQSYNEDHDYSLFKNDPHNYHNSEVQTTESSLFNDNRETTESGSYEEDEDLRGNTERSRYGHYENKDADEESTIRSQHDEFNDYPERELAEENRAHINIKVKHYPKNEVQSSAYSSQKMKKVPKKSGSLMKVRRKPITRKIKNNRENNFNKGYTTSIEEKLKEWTTTEISTRIPKKSKRLPRPIRQNLRPGTTTTKSPTDFSYNIVSWGEDFSSSSYSPPADHSNLFENNYNFSKKPSNEFRIVVPNDRRRRDIFFDDAFKSFNLSNFESFNKTDAPESTQAQFLENNGKLVPNLEYRKQLEMDIEKYVEQYVEQQISNGEIDTKKPKTTIVELKSKDGVPIKTITTTISKLVDGTKPFLESILDFSKSINPVANVAELSGESGTPVEKSTSEVGRAFQDQPKTFGESFSWNFS